MSQYWTSIVHQLDPYVPGEQPQDMQYIKLNTNENPYPPSPQVSKAVESFDTEKLRRYPDPESTGLTNTLAAYHGLEANQVFIGNGSDEVLAHSFQAFFKHSKPLLFPDISYSFYPVYCGLYQIDYKTIPLDDNFCVTVEEYTQPNGGIIIPNPNAPTGIALSLGSIETILQNTNSVVIIDEAYVDFGADSASRLINQYPNLLVVQTFSKSRSLAGLRLGYALGHADLIEGLNRVKNSFNSYPIDSIASATAIESINDEAYFQHCRNQVITSRDSLTKALVELAFDVLPSSSNFLFVQHQSLAASMLYNELRRLGILVRHFKTKRIDNYLRISIGTDEECQALVAALKSIL
ncbi:MAG: histidinol-phosphate aminotransferase [Flavobacteriales bacterium]|jgi:histidinol-phosphate aminotransferase